MYFVFFVLVGAGAYALLVTAPVPHVTFDQQPKYAANDSFTIDGQSYTVAEITTETESGGHGGGTTTKTVGKLSWTETDVPLTATVDNGTEVSRANTTYQLRTRPNESAFVLRQQRNVSAVLAADDRVRNETATIGNQRYVVFEDQQTLVPLSQYLPPADTITYEVGNESYPYEGHPTTVTAVSADGVTLNWTGSQDRSADLSQGGNVTLNNETYFVHFPNTESVQVLSVQQHYGDYQHQLAVVDYYHERQNGLWGVVILSGIAAVILLATAYLPTRG